MFCSTIIPTVGRATLSATVHSALRQTLHAAQSEVIVVNDSGKPLPEMEWQHDPRVQVIHTNRRERSIARNTGAAIAKGRFLHFLDDDDLLLAGALEAFCVLHQKYPVAIWLQGSYETVDNSGHLVRTIHPYDLTDNVFACLVAGESIPLQASLICADHFHKVGGFDSYPSIIGVEDRDLGRRLALIGVTAYTPALVARIRIGQVGSTTNWEKIAEGDRIGREKALNAPNALARLRASAKANVEHLPSYWHGRITRAYLASMVWNFQHSNVLMGAGQAWSALQFAGQYLLAPDFWQGLKTKIQ